MSDYNHVAIENKWQEKWRENHTYRAVENTDKEKFYVLDMFPYPSGAGLHVGHPLGYIASDIYARYKKHQGFEVLHPMGYDSFGLPAEQYAIQTGQHPAITTEANVARYREQLDKIGFAFDWEREVRTSSPEYYKWTQWIFKQIFNSWYNNDTDKAEDIDSLIAKFETEGNANVNAVCDEVETFTADDWNGWSIDEQRAMLMHYRLTFLADSWVNWCPALGTVLANDEIKDGVSERGGHPVEQKLMRQWSMRITAYAQRLLDGLDKIDFSDSLKEQQRNWIGKSTGASIKFEVEGCEDTIEVFTTRPDTIFGVTFMTLAPEHDLVDKITTEEYKEKVEAYKAMAGAKTERERQANVKEVTGQFTGAYATHPFTGDKVQIWIGEYVLAGYGTGAVMAVPAGDQRDYDFAKHFEIPIPNIFEGVDISEEACADKGAILANSDFLNGLTAQEGIAKAIEAIEAKGIGKGKTNYRLRDAIFSRQRYWGEPFPVYYKGDTPYLLDDDKQVTLPEVDKYLPTEDGEPPLARAKKESWNVFEGDRMEYNTMPGWAGSSWYFLRYMDANNTEEFVSKAKADYWNQVDLYIGGSEHATGHLLYSRFWTKFLFDKGYISFDEPFKKLINQGMILGNSAFTYRLSTVLFSAKKEGLTFEINGQNRAEYNFSKSFVLSKSIADKLVAEDESVEQMIKEKLDKKYKEIHVDFNENVLGEDYDISFISSPSTKERVIRRHVNIEYVDGKNQLDLLNVDRDAAGSFEGAEFILDGENFVCLREVEKMSKSKYNVQTPDELVEKYGADTLRCYEMFLGPLEQAKPWDVQGINGVNNFLKKLWRLYTVELTDGEPTKENLKSLHQAIKKVTEDLGRYSFNTVVSTFMIAVNELTSQKCSNKSILQDLVVLVSPFAPHIAEELWEKLGNTGSVTVAAWPTFDEKHLVENNFEYPVSFNGKMRFKMSLPVTLSKEEIEQALMDHEKTAGYLDGKDPKRVIVVPKRIINVVI